MSKLNSELNEVQSIMTKNIQEVLAYAKQKRGKKKRKKSDPPA